MCEICNKYPCHNHCPNYKPLKSHHYCSICNEGIYDGEEFIKNLSGEIIHYECIQGIKHLLKWLGYDIKTMSELDC